MIDAQRFARFVTDAVVRRPALWYVFRRPLQGMFDRLAPTWGTRIGPYHLWALDLALEGVVSPQRILDLGTGTGVVAKALAERYPEAEVVGIDLSPAMIEEARASGARVVTLGGEGDPATRRLPLVLVVDQPENLRIMQEEVFRPILPVVSYDDLDDAVAGVNAGERPLGLYVYSGDPQVAEHVL